MGKGKEERRKGSHWIGMGYLSSERLVVPWQWSRSYLHVITHDAHVLNNAPNMKRKSFRILKIKGERKSKPGDLYKSISYSWSNARTQRAEGYKINEKRNAIGIAYPRLTWSVWFGFASVCRYFRRLRIIDAIFTFPVQSIAKAQNIIFLIV